MTALMNVYLRRDHLTSGSVDEHRFFFLCCEEMEDAMSVEMINPRIPGNTKANVFGKDSTNFLINIGKFGTLLALRGTFQPLVAADFPTLPTSSSAAASQGMDTPNLDGSYYKYENCDETTSTIGTASTSAPSSLTARQQAIFLKFWIADQQDSTNFANWRLGFGDYLTDGVYREFHGMIVGQPKVTRVAGQPENFAFSFNFVCGDTVETA